MPTGRNETNKTRQMRESISTRPTDSSGRRASNADLGLDAAAAAAARARAAMKAVAREGTTNPSGGRAPVKMPAKIAATKPVPKPVQVIRTTVSMKSSPTTTKRK